MQSRYKTTAVLTTTATVLFGSALLWSAGLQADGGIDSPEESGTGAAFDVVHTRVTTQDRIAVFQMTMAGRAGGNKPAISGQLAGSRVFSYVWPTDLDPEVVGFEPGAGILALAVTAHPDFDDTPLYDENADGDLSNDGGVWHSHWVVLQPDESCGGQLKVADIPEGQTVTLPKTWPGLPLLIDSPGWSPVLAGEQVTVRVPFEDIGLVGQARFDGVTAGLRVNANMHNPLLCVDDVFKVASGDLSLPGRVE